jgi:hypothetical protein
MMCMQKEYTHWPLLERVLDAVWVGLLIYAGVQGVPTLGNAPDADAQTNLNTLIVAIVLLAVLVLLLVTRASRHSHSIRRKDNEVTYTQYRIFGLIPTMTKTFDINELGC